MLKFLLGAALALSSLSATEETQEQGIQISPTQSYLKLLYNHSDTLGPFGKASEGEIEIIRDPETIQQIEAQARRKTGIVYQDKFWILLNDPVRFPSGKTGIYSRLLWVNSLEGTPGVAVLPILPDGRIALNFNYRHATRSWEIELPRGGINKGESIKEACKREVKEETGKVISHLEYLGDMTPDSGMTNTVVPIYLAKVIAEEASHPEESEAIKAVLAFTIEEIKEGYRKGYLLVSKDDTQIKVPLRDPFLAFALFQAEIRNVIKETPNNLFPDPSTDRHLSKIIFELH